MRKGEIMTNRSNNNVKIDLVCRGSKRISKPKIVTHLRAFDRSTLAYKATNRLDIKSMATHNDPPCSIRTILRSFIDSDVVY